MTATITVHGGLTDAPELRYTNSGKPFISGTVASTDRYLDKQTNEWKDGKKLYARFTAWGELAENIAQSGLDRGAQVVVSGKLHTREYQDKDGQPRSSVEMELSDFGVSLKRATAQVTRVSKQGQQGGFNGGSGQGQGDWVQPPANGAPAAFQGGGSFDDEPQPF